MKYTLALCTAVVSVVCASTQAQDTRKSGAEFMSPATRTMQRDDTQNPGMLWVLEGQKLWDQTNAGNGKSCATCHAQSASMRGVAVRYPAMDAAENRPVTLAARINLCRTRHQLAKEYEAESQPLLALETLIAHQSRGMPIAAPGAALAAHVGRGEQLFKQPLGQINLSCAQCHDQNAGGKLAGSVIPQAHPTGYPLYRLDWQTLGSLQRRLRNCMTGVRAEPYAFGAPDLTELELYLNSRAAGMLLETPAVRP